MDLVKAFGGLVNGALNTVGLGSHPQAKPVNYRPINLGQGSMNLQGGGTQRVQQAAPVRQAPVLTIPHINLNTNQIVHLPIQQVASQKPKFNFAQINQAAGLNNHAPSIATNASSNPVNRVIDAYSHLVGQPTTGQVTQQKQQLQRLTPKQQVKFQLTDPTTLKTNIAALAGGNGEGNVAKSLSRPLAKGATQLINAAKTAAHYPEFEKKAGAIAAKGGPDIFKNIDDSVNFFLQHNTKGKIVNPNNFANPYTLQGAGKQTPLISKIVPPTKEQTAARFAQLRAERETPPQGVLSNLKKFLGNERGGTLNAVPINVSTGGAPLAAKATVAAAKKLVKGGNPSQTLIPTGLSNEVEALNQLRPGTTPINLLSTVEQTRNVATKTTKAGNVLPIGRKSGAFVPKDWMTAEFSGKTPIGIPERVTKQISKDPKVQAAFERDVVTPNNAAVSAGNQEIAGLKKQGQQIFGDSGLLHNKNLHSPFFDYVQNGDYKGLVKQVGEGTAGKLKVADTQLRKVYDTLFKQQNEVRVAHGQQPIPYRKNYITHLQESGFLGNLGLGGEVQAAKSPFSRSIGKMNPFAKERTGGAYQKDPVKAFDAYIQNAVREKHSIPVVARMNSVLDALSQNPNAPQNLVNWVTQQRNIVGGAGHRLDSAISQGSIGKKALDATSLGSQQAGANLIGLNPASVLSQPATLLQGGAKFGWGNLIKGGVKAAIHPGEATSKSEFLAGRHADTSVISPGIRQKLINASLMPIEKSQKAVDLIIHEAAQVRAKQMGLKGEEAAKWADKATQTTVAARGAGQTPQSYSSKALNPLLQFSLEMGNALHQLAADDLRGGKLGGLARYSVGAYAFNQGYNATTGKNNGVVFDPIQAGIDTAGDVSKGKYLQAGARIPGEVIANAPGGQIAAGVVNSADKKLGNQIFGQSGAGRYGVGVPALSIGSSLLNAPKNPLGAAAFLAPAGGVPITRGIKGIGDALAGSHLDSKGKQEYTIAQTPGNLVKSALFGSGATKEGQQYGQVVNLKNAGLLKTPATGSSAKLPANSQDAITKLNNQKTQIQASNGFLGSGFGRESQQQKDQQIAAIDKQIAQLKGPKAAAKYTKDQFTNSSNPFQIQGTQAWYKDSSGSVKTLNLDPKTASQKNTVIKNAFQLLQDQGLSQTDANSVFKKLGVSAPQAETIYAKHLNATDKGAYILDKLQSGGNAVQLAKDGILTTSVAGTLRTNGDISQEDYVKLYQIAKANTPDLAAERKAAGIGVKAKKLPKVPALKLAKIKSSSIKFKGVSTPKATKPRFKTYSQSTKKTKQVTLA